MSERLIVGITGGSGAIYGVRLLHRALESYDEVYACVSHAASIVLRQELDREFDPENPSAEALLGRSPSNLTLLTPKDFMSPPASGSFRHSGMIIAPCSMGTAGRIANGVSDDLISRAADVCLKERSPLVLIIRESPLSLVHLKNLTALTEAGAIVMPAAPGFYFRPKTIDEMVDSVVVRALQVIGRVDPSAKEWGKH
jgi:4-hydroxy-3-polyprenylbenzoate decarboxylase